MLAEHRTGDPRLKSGDSRSERTVFNPVAIAAFYEARDMLGITTPGEKDAARRLLPPVAKTVVHTEGNQCFRGAEGPDIALYIEGLIEKLGEIPTGRTGRKARKAAEARARIEGIISALDQNSTGERLDGSQGRNFWELGNRSEREYMRYRILHEAKRIAFIEGPRSDNVTAAREAMESLAGRRELIVSVDEGFYKVKKGELKPEDMTVVPVPGLGLELPGYEANSEDATYFQPDHQETWEEEPVLEAKVVAGSTPNSTRPTRQWSFNKPVIAATVATALAMPLVGAAAVSYLRNRPSSTAIVDYVPTELGSKVTIPVPVEPITSTTTAEQKVAPTTTIPIPEIVKAENPLGIKWLTDTVTIPWGEKIVKESAKYGMNPAIPATYLQIKTAGDYTFISPGYTGLFQLSDDVIREGMRALYGIEVINPTLTGLDGIRNIEIAIWNINRNKVEGSVSKTIGNIEGSEGYVSQLVADLVADAKLETSATLEKWKNNGGNAVIKTARTRLEGMI